MGRTFSLKPDATGRYYRNLGQMPFGRGQPKFMLGKDRAEAAVRNARLEMLWAARCELAVEIGRPPVWDEPTISIARMMADGRLPCVGTRKEIRTLQQLKLALCLPLHMLDPKGDDTTAKPRGVGMTTHAALDAFREDERARLSAGETLSQWGAVRLRQIDWLRSHLPDVDLSGFGEGEIESVIRRVVARPPSQTRSKKGAKPITRKTAQVEIKTLRNWLSWMHRAKQVPWRKPEDYEVSPVRIKATPEEKASARPDQVAVFTVDELALLWRYATPTDRLYLVLALNCGFARREIATLRRDEVLLHHEHPHASLVGILSDPSDSWILRVRQKTEVFGEWRLWPITVQGIEWYLARRPASPLPYLMLSKSGRCLFEQTKGGHEKSVVANRWNHLLDRLRKDRPDFPPRSFKILRKTGANLIRLDGGAEVAGRYLSPGRPAEETDDLLEDYTNKPWCRSHGAVWQLGARLKPVWDAVADPFPEADHSTGGPNISRGRIDKILELCAKGWKPGRVAREVGVSRETVRRWKNRASSGKTAR